MPITAVFDGYVVNQPSFAEATYGRYAEVTLRTAISGKEVHYVIARFYGKKINVIRDFVHGGDYMTISGSVNSIQHGVKETGAKYCRIYLRDSFFTIPPKVSAAPVTAPVSQSSYRVDEGGDWDDNEVPF